MQLHSQKWNIGYKRPLLLIPHYIMSPDMVSVFSPDLLSIPSSVIATFVSDGPNLIDHSMYFFGIANPGLHSLSLGILSLTSFSLVESFWNSCIFQKEESKTRKHSSRMRTARLLTVSCSIPCILREGEVCPTPCGYKCLCM